MATSRTPSKQTAPKQPAKTRATKNIVEPVAKQEVIEYEAPRRNYARYAAGLFAVVLAAGAGYGYYKYDQQRTELNNQGAEGVLKALGFDKENIIIDVQGDTNRLQVTCPDTQPITYFYNADTGAAYLEVSPLYDATGAKGGVVLKDGFTIPFPLDTAEHVETFITDDFLPACENLSNN